MTKTKLLAGASALAALGLALASGAQAAVTTQVFGAGSTLIGPYLRQVEDCYGSPTPLVYQGTAQTPAPYYPAGTETYSGSALNTGGVTPLPAITPFDYLGGTGFNCATTHVNANFQLNYINTGSGNGQLAIMTHDVTDDIGVTTEAGAPATTLQYTSVQYGMGDYGIGQPDVAAFTSGGPLSQKDGDNNVVTIPAGGNAGKYGNFVQYPISIDAVALAYPPSYGLYTNAGGTTISLSFNVKKKNGDGSGGLLLDMPTVCAIMNGKITNWNDPALKALNGALALYDVNDPHKGAGWSVPIQLVGRADGSGTTSLFYRALAAQCGQGSVTYIEYGDNYTYTNAFLPAGSHKLPGGVIGAGAGQFLTFTGSSGVAAELGSTIPTPAPGNVNYFGPLGYLGTDYVLPAVASTGQNTYNLHVANIAANPAWTPSKPTAVPVGIEPTHTSALAAFGAGLNALLPPQSNSSGQYVAAGGASSHGLRAQAQDWAEPTSTTVTYINDPADGGATQTINTPLADPDHNITGVTKAYPIVGTTNAFLNTCYDGSPVAGAVLALFRYFENNALVTSAVKTTPGVLVSAGLSPLPKSWLTASTDTFLTPVTTGAYATNALNLYLLQAGTGPATGTGSQCKAVTPGA